MRRPAAAPAALEILEVQVPLQGKFSQTSTAVACEGAEKIHVPR